MVEPTYYRGKLFIQLRSVIEATGNRVNWVGYPVVYVRVQKVLSLEPYVGSDIMYCFGNAMISIDLLPDIGFMVEEIDIDNGSVDIDRPYDMEYGVDFKNIDKAFLISIKSSE